MGEELNWNEISNEFARLASEIKQELSTDEGIATIVATNIGYDNRDRLSIMIRVENKEGYFEDRLDLLTPHDMDKVKQAKFYRIKACVFGPLGLSSNSDIVAAVSSMIGLEVRYQLERRNYVNKRGLQIEIRALKSLTATGIKAIEPNNTDVLF